MQRYTTDSKRKINIEQNEKGLILREASFEPSHIFECGQCFNFHKEEDGSYTAVFLGKIINVLKLDEGVSLIRNISLEDFNDIFYDYFDLGLDYEAIKEEIAIDPVMEKATAYGYGIRILNQEVFETTISFIISANNQIPRIKKAVRIISERYGNFLGEYKGRKYYSFPTPEVLMKVKPEDLREYARVGFRDKRIVEASRMIYEGHLEEANDLDTEDLRKRLIELPGVGPKVADCILLFAYHRRETFPVDVWIKRVMETLFIKKEVPKKQVDDYARKYFGKNAGYAQQYLFYYGREEKIGK
ncbi:DNA-3-methyladenine glycosylase family protein [Anaerococcus marasmi]|uniref:DNA-3-methyladenine glycosylase family protein n=1 Tax=Anaerococcus marasmi TaxID=2057797 RepID=UPI000CF85E59|nr:8-oxoguanine DNA glycosylase [Anaerococcus marasmi]